MECWSWFVSNSQTVSGLAMDTGANILVWSFLFRSNRYRDMIHVDVQIRDGAQISIYYLTYSSRHAYWGKV